MMPGQHYGLGKLGHLGHLARGVKKGGREAILIWLFQFTDYTFPINSLRKLDFRWLNCFENSNPYDKISVGCRSSPDSDY